MPKEGFSIDGCFNEGHRVGSDRMRRRVAIGVLSIFGVFALIVEALGHLTWHLSPRDPAAIEEAGRLQSLLSSMVKTPESGLVSAQGISSRAGRFDSGARAVSRHRTFQGVHRVGEWPPDSEKPFHEAPLLAERVEEGMLPPVADRLPQQPLVIIPPQQNGPYGGKWTRLGTGPKDINIVEARFAYEGLVRWGPKGKEILPNVARKWEVSEDGKVFTFWLREGMRWSDGQPFTVDDILFWRNEILLNKEITPVLIREFKRGGEPVEIEKVSETVFRFRFREPHGLFLKALASGRGAGEIAFGLRGHGPARPRCRRSPPFRSVFWLAESSRGTFPDRHRQRSPVQLHQTL